MPMGWHLGGWGGGIQPIFACKWVADGLKPWP